MAPTYLVPLSLMLMLSGLLFGAWWTTRANTGPLGYWLLAWASLAAAGVVRASPLPRQIDIVCGILFAALILAGAIRYVDRSVPKNLLPLSACAGVAVALGSYTPLRAVAQFAGATLEVVAILFAAVLVQKMATRDARPWFHRLIAPGLLLVAALDVAEHLGLLTDQQNLAPWLCLAIPLGTVQIVSTVDRIQVRAADAATALEQTVSLLKATLESTADGLLVVNRDGTISSFNGAFATMWGIPQSILDQRDDNAALEFAMTKLEDPEVFFDKVKALYDRPSDESFDTLDFKDGHVFERYSRPQYVGDEIVGRVWSFRDVTERLRAEELAARHQDHLEELVEERTQALLVSRDRLRQADRLVAVGTLAAGVAHQINNPVGVILNSAEYALMCEKESDAKETFKRALEVNVSEAKRCADIVRSMLQFAREQPVETRVENLNPVVQRACRAAETYARDHDAKITVALFDTPLPVRMSAIEIEQVVVNVVRNAIESRDTGARVDVRTERKGDRAHILVSDNGRGISHNDQGRIFDPFYSTRVAQGGTGLGLSVAHGIVVEHQGEISADSSQGNGTVFLIDLPTFADDT